jgi:CubicO group peptidase (beta-lactamase class C family)
MSKPITSVAAMMLYEEGAFNLNTPVSKFISGFADTQVFVKEEDGKLVTEPLKVPLTMRHLFTHTAGLTYGWSPTHPVDKLYQEHPAAKPQPPGSPLTLKDTVEALTKLPLKFQPGTHWEYSLSIAVIGHIVEIISGQRLDVFLNERLFKPLGMVDTEFYVPKEKMARLATVYAHLPGETELQRMDTTFLNVFNEPPVYLIPDGGLLSTLLDYGRFAQMLVNGGQLDGKRYLSPTTIAMMEMNQTPLAALPYSFSETDLYHLGYGYGVGMRVLMDVAASGQYGSVGEFGWDGAFSTYFWIDRTEQLYGLLMLQHHPNAYYPIANEFKALVYQALE